MSRYLIDSDHLSHISRIDRETECYWMRLEEAFSGPYWSRWKKRPYNDRVYETFEEAREELVLRLTMRTVKAKNLTDGERWQFISDIKAEDRTPTRQEGGDNV